MRKLILSLAAALFSFVLSFELLAADLLCASAENYTRFLSKATEDGLTLAAITQLSDSRVQLFNIKTLDSTQRKSSCYGLLYIKFDETSDRVKLAKKIALEKGLNFSTLQKIHGVTWNIILGEDGDSKIENIKLHEASVYSTARLEGNRAPTCDEPQVINYVKDLLYDSKNIYTNIDNGLDGVPVFGDISTVRVLNNNHGYWCKTNVLIQYNDAQLLNKINPSYDIQKYSSVKPLFYRVEIYPNDPDKTWKLDTFYSPVLGVDGLPVDKDEYGYAKDTVQSKPETNQNPSELSCSNEQVLETVSEVASKSALFLDTSNAKNPRYRLKPIVNYKGIVTVKSSEKRNEFFCLGIAVVSYETDPLTRENYSYIVEKLRTSKNKVEQVIYKSLIFSNGEHRWEWKAQLSDDETYLHVEVKESR